MVPEPLILAFLTSIPIHPWEDERDLIVADGGNYGEGYAFGFWDGCGGGTGDGLGHGSADGYGGTLDGWGNVNGCGTGDGYGFIDGSWMDREFSHELARRGL